MITTFEDRLLLIDSILGKCNPPRDSASVRAALTELTGGSVEALPHIRYEDLTKSVTDLPIALARQIVETVCRGQSNGSPAAPRSGRISRFAADTYSTAELVRSLASEPFNVNGVALRTLRSRFGARAVLAYDDRNNLLVDAAIQHLEAIESGDPVRSHVIVDGRPRQLYPLGVMPGKLVFVDPVTGDDLYPDGTNEQGLNWGAVDIEKRQLIWIAVRETKELQASELRDSMQRITLFQLVSSTPMDQLRSNFSKASLRFDECERRQELPSLRREMTVNLNVKAQNAGKALSEDLLRS